jgi:zinc transport system substrate-binding protein
MKFGRALYEKKLLKAFRFLLPAAIALIFSLCRQTASFGAPEPPFTVYTVNYPLTYFTERIGGEHARVIFPAPPDVDPAFYAPNTAIVRKYQKADLIILNGAG